MKRLMPLLILVLLAVAIWRGNQPLPVRTQLIYSGIVEATAVECAFEIAGTVEKVLVQEGQEVKKGQPLAYLDRRSWQTNLAQAQAREGSAKARYELLRNGYRPEEVQQALARLEMAQAELAQWENGATQPQLEAARSQMEAARRRADMMQEGYRQEEIESARSQWEGAQTNLKTTEVDAHRFRKLHKEGAISDQQLESRLNALAQARSQYQVARENYQRLQRGPRPQERQAAWEEYRSAAARYQDLAQGTRPEQIERARAQVQERQKAVQLMQAGPRREEIESARQQWQEARASLEAARVQLSKAELLSPLDGVISLRNLEPGEAVAAGVSVLSLSDLRHPWVSLYLPEYERTRVRLGQAGRVISEGMQKPLPGSLVRIYEKAEFTPKFIQTPRERVNLVYRAKLAFENPDQVLHPGQPVDVELLP